jgi:hypothetical protein
MPSFSKKELALIKRLNTPAKVQDYLNSLKFNFERVGNKKIPTLKSPINVMRQKNAHCLEAAILGAYILSKHGFKPLLLHLQATKGDYDHVVAPFKVGRFWGALSKTNHAVLRYREPVYKDVRELAMSYFHEYFLDNGLKTFRSYSESLDLGVFESGWEHAQEELWGIDEELDKIKHYDVVPKNYIKKLRQADKVEIKAGKVVEYKND